MNLPRPKGDQRFDSGWIFRRMSLVQDQLAAEITDHLEKSYGKRFWATAVTTRSSLGTAIKCWGLMELVGRDYVCGPEVFALEDVTGLLDAARTLATNGKVVPIRRRTKR